VRCAVPQGTLRFDQRGDSLISPRPIVWREDRQPVAGIVAVLARAVVRGQKLGWAPTPDLLSVHGYELLEPDDAGGSNGYRVRSWKKQLTTSQLRPASPLAACAASGPQLARSSEATRHHRRSRATRRRAMRAFGNSIRNVGEVTFAAVGRSAGVL